MANRYRVRVRPFCGHLFEVCLTRRVRSAALGLAACAWGLAACQQKVAPEPIDLPDSFVQGDVAPEVAAADVKVAKWVTDASPPVPTAIAPPAACTTTWNFPTPALPEPVGDVGIEPSSPLVPTGVDEKVFLYVILPGKSTLDTAADGPLAVTTTQGATVQAVQFANKGVGSAVLRFATEGQHTITATYADGRTGTIAVQAYATKLPVWQIDMPGATFAAMLADPYYKQYRPCALWVGDQFYPNAEIRLHGGTSVDLLKRSFRINLKGGASLPDGRKRLILRSEYIDKSMLRTAIGYEAFRQATWLPVPKTEFLHMRVGQRMYGVMQLVEHLDGDWLATRGRNGNGTLYEGDPPHEMSNPGANLTPLFPADQYAKTYAKHQGPKGLADLVSFIEQVLLLPDDKLAKTLDLYLKVRDWIEYAAMMAVLQNHEHIRKNWYMYRDHDGVDDRFELLAWDLDLTFGHLWSLEKDAFDETIIADAPADKGSKKVDGVFFNQLYRTLDRPEWRAIWQQRVLALADLVLDESFLGPRIDALLCTLGPDVFADPRKRATNAEYLQRVEELRAFAKARRLSLHAQLDGK